MPAETSAAPLAPIAICVASDAGTLVAAIVADGSTY